MFIVGTATCLILTRAHRYGYFRLDGTMTIPKRQKMVDQFNLRVANQGIDPSEMRAVCTKLKGTDDELDGLKFDYVTVSEHLPQYS